MAEWGDTAGAIGTEVGLGLGQRADIITVKMRPKEMSITHFELKLPKDNILDGPNAPSDSYVKALVMAEQRQAYIEENIHLIKR